MEDPMLNIFLTLQTLLAHPRRAHVPFQAHKRGHEVQLNGHLGKMAEQNLA